MQLVSDLDMPLAKAREKADPARSLYLEGIDAQRENLERKRAKSRPEVGVRRVTTIPAQAQQ